MKLKFWQRNAGPAQSAPAETGTVPRRPMRGLRSLAHMFKASFTDTNDKWSATPISPDVFITLRQPILVARSREQWSNNDYVRGFVRQVRQNVVGSHGVKLQAKVRKPRGALDKDVNAAIEAAWKDFGRKGVLDVTGKLSWRELQCLAVETAARDGEFIIRIVRGRGPHLLQLQMLDPQRLSVKYENYKYGNNGNFIRQGIEFDPYGKPVAYHFTSTEEWDAYYYSISGRGFVRVPADEIIHGYIQEMVGQRRGLPWASTSLFRLHHLQGFEDASVQNARAGSTQMGFITYREGFGPEAEDGDDVGGSIDAEPLAFHELPEGAEFTPFTPNYPNGEFMPFHKAMLRGAATGMGVAYNGLANDLEGVNFSSIRQGALNERDNWKECQQWLIETLIQPVFELWLGAQLLAGNITSKGQPLPPAKLRDYCGACTWQGRRWPWIDPRADVQAALESIRGGLTSPSRVIREQGHDPKEVFAEIADDIKQMKEAGIPDNIIQLIFTGEIPPPPPAQPDPPQDPKAD